MLAEETKVVMKVSREVSINCRGSAVREGGRREGGWYVGG